MKTFDDCRTLQTLNAATVVEDEGYASAKDTDAKGARDEDIGLGACHLARILYGYTPKLYVSTPFCISGTSRA